MYPRHNKKRLSASQDTSFPR